MSAVAKPVVGGAKAAAKPAPVKSAKTAVVVKAKMPQQVKAKNGFENAQAEETLRGGVRESLRRMLAGCKTAEGKAAADVAAELEAALYARAVAEHRTAGRTLKSLYVELYARSEKALAHSPGEFPDEPIGARLLARTLTAAEAAAEPMLNTTLQPRDHIRRMFVASLLGHAAVTRPDAADLARKIEAACYDAVIVASKNAERPCRRLWSSPAFEAMYSSRCATVNDHLAPRGSAAREFKVDLVADLLAGRVRPAELGTMSAAQMCPAACGAERDRIALQREQKIQKKFSNLFRCPAALCGARRCEYIAVQTRGPDEPPTYKCTCLVCGLRFIGQG